MSSLRRSIPRVSVAGFDRPGRALIKTALMVTIGLSFLVAQVNAQVTVNVWSGNGNNDDWSFGANWVDGEPPTSGNQTGVVFADSTVRPVANQNIGNPITIQSMFLQSSANAAFEIVGGGINFDGGTFEIDGSNERDAFMSNGLNFTNDADIVFANNARLIYDGTAFSGTGQTGGLVDVSGNGELVFEFGSIPTLSAHLNVSQNVFVNFQSGSVPVSITNGFDTQGDVLLGFTTLDFLAGGNIEGNVESQAGTIRNSVNINGFTTVSGESSLDIDDDSAINGTGEVEVFDTGVLTLNNNSFIRQNVFAGQGGFVQGNSTTSTITGTVRTEGGGFFGTLRMEDNLIADGNVRSFIFEDASVNVSGLTDIVSGVLEIGSNANLSGDGAAIVRSGAALDLQLGTVNKKVTVEQGGFLNGNGLINGDLDIFGLFEPGNSAGTIEIDGDVRMSDTTVTCVEIGGSAAGTFDLIRSPDEGNEANLDGTLVVTFLDDYVPSEDDEFSFIDGFMINGTFGNTGPNFNSGGTEFLSFGTLDTNLGTFQVEYGSNFVRLFAFSAVPEPSSFAVVALLMSGIAVRRRR